MRFSRSRLPRSVPKQGCPQISSRHFLITATVAWRSRTRSSSTRSAPICGSREIRRRSSPATCFHRHGSSSATGPKPGRGAARPSGPGSRYWGRKVHRARRNRRFRASPEKSPCRRPGRRSHRHRHPETPRPFLRHSGRLVIARRRPIFSSCSARSSRRRWIEGTVTHVASGVPTRRALGQSRNDGAKGSALHRDENSRSEPKSGTDVT